MTHPQPVHRGPATVRTMAPAAGGGSPIRAVRPDVLVAELVELCRTRPVGGSLRVAVDGAPAAQPASLAAVLAERLRANGRPCGVVDLNDWLRPASLRLEHGRRDAESFRQNWFDYAAVRREVLDPLGPEGSGQWLAALWDADADRATRAQRQSAPDGMVVLVSGPMLLGRGLPFDLTVHLHLSPPMLRRRTPAELEWTVAALLAHEDLTHSADLADVMVRADHPERPAIRVSDAEATSRE